MLNILVTGSNGQVGLELQSLQTQHKEFNWFFVDKSTLDISLESSVEFFVNKFAIDVIINCAAFTNVELAEDDFGSSNLVNNLAVREISNLSEIYDYIFVHISTDAVFDGSKKKITNCFNKYKGDDLFIVEKNGINLSKITINSFIKEIK